MKKAILILEERKNIIQNNIKVFEYYNGFGNKYKDDINELYSVINSINKVINKLTENKLIYLELFYFFMWFRENGEKHLNVSIEKMIEIYLKSKTNKNI